MMANVSVGALFLAGILPGVVMALLMMLTVAYFAHRRLGRRRPLRVAAQFAKGWSRRSSSSPSAAAVAARGARPLTGAISRWSALVVLFVADWHFDFRP